MIKSKLKILAYNTMPISLVLCFNEDTIRNIAIFQITLQLPEQKPWEEQFIILTKGKVEPYQSAI